MRSNMYERVTKAERFDTVENRWEEIENMNKNWRRGVLGVAFSLKD